MKEQFQLPALPEGWRWAIKGPYDEEAYTGWDRDFKIKVTVYHLFAVTGTAPNDCWIQREVKIQKHSDGRQIFELFSATAEELLEDIDRHVEYRSAEQALTEVYAAVARSQLSVEPDLNYDYSTRTYRLDYELSPNDTQLREDDEGGE